MAATPEGQLSISYVEAIQKLAAGTAVVAASKKKSDLFFLVVYLQGKAG